MWASRDSFEAHVRQVHPDAGANAFVIQSLVKTHNSPELEPHTVDSPNRSWLPDFCPDSGYQEPIPRRAMFSSLSRINRISRGSTYIPWTSTNEDVACSEEQVQQVKKSRKAKPIPRYQASRSTPLYAAAAKGDEEAIRRLVEAGADVNLRKGDCDTALYVAADRGYEKIVRLLLEAGADANLRGENRGTALCAAVNRGYEKIVRLLLEAGADINVCQENHGTALYVAAASENENIVRLLLEAGADANLRGGDSGTALYAAADKGNEKIVRLLLDAGIDVNACGGVKNSALYIAASRGDETIVQLLLEAGADVKACGRTKNITALSVAASRGHEKVMQILLEATANSNARGRHRNNKVAQDQDLITHFGDMLIEKAGSCLRGAFASGRYTTSFLDDRLDTLLILYGMNLFSRSEDSQNNLNLDSHAELTTDSRLLSFQKQMARLVQRYGLEIAQYFRESSLRRFSGGSTSLAVGKDQPNDETTGSPFEEGDSTTVVLRRLGNKGHDGNEHKAHGGFNDLVAEESFRELLIALKKLYFDPEGAMRRVHDVVAMGLMEVVHGNQPNSHLQTSESTYADGEAIHEARFNMKWCLREYMSSQYGSTKPTIASTVVLAGSALYGQATTYAKYIKGVWPKTGSRFLTAISALTDQNEQENIEPVTVDTSSDTILFHRPTSSESSDSIMVRGSKEWVIDVAQMLAFTGAAFHPSPHEEQVTYCRPEVTKSDCSTESVVHFDMDFESEELHSTEDSCWLSLFDAASIARDFPIPERGDEEGLEMPIEMMAAIAGARHAVEYQGGIVMKGYSHMLVPITRKEDRVQWHLISSDRDDTRLVYHEVSERYPNRASLDQVNLQTIHETRAILGWCSVARTMLGSTVVEYNNIDYSTAQPSRSGIKLSSASIGFQQFASAQLEFQLGAKDGRCHFQRTGGPYRNIISAAEKTRMVLYDTCDKRAWLVPATEVILHMAHHRHIIEPFEVGGKPVQLPATNHKGLTPKQILFQAADTDLSDIEMYKFKDMITSIWSLLEFLVDQRITRSQNTGVAVPSSSRDVLYGFEFKAVVEERSPFQLKQTPIAKTNGGWPALVGDIDALVLFASGLGNVICPVRDDIANLKLCHSWSTMPAGKDYLAARVGIMCDIYNTSGYPSCRTYLTSSCLRWHKGRSILFEACQTPGDFWCRCSRLQQIVPKVAMGCVIPHGRLKAEGAVIFGQSESPFCSISPTKRPSESIYSLPNTALNIPMATTDETDEASFADSDTEPVTHSVLEDEETTRVTVWISDHSPDGIKVANKSVKTKSNREAPTSHDACLKTPNNNILANNPGVCSQRTAGRNDKRQSSPSRSGQQAVISSSSSTKTATATG